MTRGSTDVLSRGKAAYIQIISNRAGAKASVPRHSETWRKEWVVYAQVPSRPV